MEMDILNGYLNDFVFLYTEIFMNIVYVLFGFRLVRKMLLYLESSYSEFPFSFFRFGRKTDII